MNAGGSSVRRDSSESLSQLDRSKRSTSGRLLSKHKTRLYLQKLLESAGLQKDARKLKDCGTHFKTLKTEGNHVAAYSPLFKCRVRSCPYCAADRANKSFERYLPKVLKLKQEKPFYRVVLLTLTLDGDSSVRDEPLRVQMKKIQVWLRNMRRTKLWKAHVAGGVQGLEATFNVERRQWHAHVHLLLFRKAFFNDEEIVDLWKSETDGAGGFVKISEVKSASLRGAVAETTKYILKPADIHEWSPKQAVEHSELRGMHLAETFGELRKIKVNKRDVEFLLQRKPRPEAGDKCPCGCGELLYWGTMRIEGLLRAKMVGGQVDDDEPG